MPTSLLATAPACMPQPTPRAEEDRLAQAVRELYGTGWAVYEGVRNTTGSPHDVLRYADVIAVDLWTGPEGWRIHGFEIKRTRKDWQNELRNPAKSAPIKLFCAAWYVVVPAPWTNLILTLSEVPDRWGVIEVGTGGASFVLHAGERNAEDPTGGFLRSLLRAGASAGSGAVASAVGSGTSGVGAEPVVAVTRPYLSKTRVGLACGHAVTNFAKVKPDRLPCEGCVRGWPTDLEMVEAAIADATPEVRDRLLALLAVPSLPRAGGGAA